MLRHMDDNVKIVENLCLNITHKGSQLRKARQLGTSGIPFTKYTSRAEKGDCVGAKDIGFGLWIDIVHGGYPNLWSNLCHWADTMFPLFVAASEGWLHNVSDVFIWQVKRSRFSDEQIYASLLRVVLHEARVVKPRLHFDEHLPVGTRLLFRRVVTANFPLKHADLASHFTGCARGLDTLALRLRYRDVSLRLFSVTPKTSRTILYTPRARVALLNVSLAATIAHRRGFEFVVRAFDARVPYKTQLETLASAHILMSSHGAGMVHIPMLQMVGAVVEFFNCKHASYMYRNLAMHSGLYYEAVYEKEECQFAPPTPLHASTRERLSSNTKIPQQRWLSAMYRAMRYVHWGSWRSP